MSKYATKVLGLLVVMFAVAMGQSFADENADQALKGDVKALTNKVSTLERQVQVLSSTPRDNSTAYVPPAGESGGGLIHTAQDIKMSGYADVQYNNNLSNHTSNVGGNIHRTNDANQNTFSINQFDLDFRKVANPEGGAGFELDILMGEDAQYIDTATTGADGDEFAFVSAYIEVVAPLNFLEGSEILDDTVNIKAGRFTTLAGTEVIRTPDNWNISRGFLYGLAVPFTHTGVRAQYNLFNDKVTTYWGLNNGWDANLDNNTFKTWEFGLGSQLTETLSWLSSIYYGPENANQNSHRRFLLSNVASWNATEKLSFKGEITFGAQNRMVATNLNENARWFGLGGHVHYNLTDRWGLAYRMELFRDIESSRTDPTRAGFIAADTLWEMTFGTDYKIYDGLTGRLEYRFDKGEQNSVFNSDSSQSTLGAQLIYNFA